VKKRKSLAKVWMRLFPIWWGIGLSFLFFFWSERAVAARNAKGENEMHFQLTILVDNTVRGKNLWKDWGFSCLISWRGSKILFDTGSQPDILNHNARVLGIDLKKISTVFLSHIHSDHTGGLPAILSANPAVTIWVPASFPQSFTESVASFKTTVRRVSGPEEILPGIFSTGELGTSIREQSLVIETPRGLVVVTGCSHPGIVTILETVQKQFHKNIYFVVGGFHLNWTSDEKVRDIVHKFKQLGVEKVAPAHCTGSRAENLFQKIYGSQYVPAGAGLLLDWDLGE